LPESSVIPIKDVIFEHRLYLPTVGFGIFLASAIYYIFENKLVKTAIIILSIAGVLYSALTYNRNFIWKDKFTLWDDAVGKSPNKARPIYGRGTVYRDRGDLDQAISDCNKAIELDPECAEAYNSRGIAYVKKDNIDQAIADYNKAIALVPEYAEAYNNRGAPYLKKGNFDQALADCNKAIELNPRYASAYYNRALVYFIIEQYAKSREDLHRAQALGCEINPEFVEALKKQEKQQTAITIH
jgi:tetratricopeptide (TPR) repeat protein